MAIKLAGRHPIRLGRDDGFGSGLFDRGDQRSGIECLIGDHRRGGNAVDQRLRLG